MELIKLYMIQESEKPYRTVKEKLSRGGIVLIMSTTSLINIKGMETIIFINFYMIQKSEKPYRTVKEKLSRGA